MSLSEAVLAIAERIEKEAMEIDEDLDEYTHSKVSRKVMLGFANELKIAVKASEGVQSTTANYNQALYGYDPVSAKDLHRQHTQAARAEFKGKVKKIDGPLAPSNDLVDAEERLDNRMLACIGGSNDGVCIPVPHDTPIGKELTSPDGEVYQLGEDNQLHFLRRIVK